MGKWFKKAIKAWRKDESGATAVEYGLLVAAVAVTIIASVYMFGRDIETMFTNLSIILTGPPEP